MTAENRRIVLARRPVGMPVQDDFRMERTPIPAPGPGQVLLQTVWLSLDPYVRGRMSGAASYAEAMGIGDVVIGGTVSRVVASEAASLRPGDLVVSMTGWQDYGVADARLVRKLDPAAAPASTALGVLGMPGLTAYVGLLDIGKPKPGETVVVSAAAGAVGSLVGQLAKLRDCRAVGIAGGAEKCRHVVRDLGFDACIDYRSPDFVDRLREACPRGIDVYFENVGGAVGDACLDLMNVFGRVALCGRIAEYNATGSPAGIDRAPALHLQILVRRLTLQGFIVSDHWNRLPAFLEEVAPLVRSRRITYREQIVAGLENAPAAFAGLLSGHNVGKMLVAVSPDITPPAVTPG